MIIKVQTVKLENFVESDQMEILVITKAQQLVIKRIAIVLAYVLEDLQEIIVK